MSFALPRNLTEFAEARGWTEWIVSLPTTIEALSARWSLEIGQPFQPGGRTAWVAPARRRSYGDVVLKVAHRHYEALDEAKGLGEWDGEGAVRLFAAEDLDRSTTALLLERCRPGTALSRHPGETQDRVIAGLLPLQHLLNCEGRLRADPTALLDRLARMLDLDRHRLEHWLFARCVVESPDRRELMAVARLLAPV